MPFRVTDITSAPKMTLYDLIFPTGTPVKPSEQQKRKPKSLYATTHCFKRVSTWPQFKYISFRFILFKNWGHANIQQKYFYYKWTAQFAFTSEIKLSTQVLFFVRPGDWLRKLTQAVKTENSFTWKSKVRLDINYTQRLVTVTQQIFIFLVKLVKWS